MPFDIRQFDRLSPESDADEEHFAEYSETLLEDFFASPEGLALSEQYPDAGFWSSQFIRYGHDYLGVPLTRVTKAHAEELLTEILPRKISLGAPEHADVAIPELTAFWQYLRREHKLTQADAILTLLEDVAPNFKRWMNDPSKFGMAKSLMMAGQGAGFDMTRKEGFDAFMIAYNAGLIPDAAGRLATDALPDGWPPPDGADWPSAVRSLGPASASNDRDKAKAKKKRKAADASRRKNRKR